MYGSNVYLLPNETNRYVITGYLKNQSALTMAHLISLSRKTGRAKQISKCLKRRNLIFRLIRHFLL